MASCVYCGRETYPFKIRVGKVDTTPSPVCGRCRGGAGGRAQAARAATRAASRYFDVALAAREKGTSR